jgi:hypothetical protein
MRHGSDSRGEHSFALPKLQSFVISNNLLFAAAAGAITMNPKLKTVAALACIECRRNFTLLSRRILLTRGLDARQSCKPEGYECAHYNPMRGDMQKDSAVNQAPERYQNPKDVECE